MGFAVADAAASFPAFAVRFAFVVSADWLALFVVFGAAGAGVAVLLEAASRVVQPANKSTETKRVEGIMCALFICWYESFLSVLTSRSRRFLGLGFYGRPLILTNASDSLHGGRAHIGA